MELMEGSCCGCRGTGALPFTIWVPEWGILTLLYTRVYAKAPLYFIPHHVHHTNPISQSTLLHSLCRQLETKDGP